MGINDILIPIAKPDKINVYEYFFWFKKYKEKEHKKNPKVSGLTIFPFQNTNGQDIKKIKIINFWSSLKNFIKKMIFVIQIIKKINLVKIGVNRNFKKNQNIWPKFS